MFDYRNYTHRHCESQGKRIIKELTGLNLIAIQDKDHIKSFQKLRSKLRSKKGTISLDEITKEVELVRRKRHGKKD